MTRTKMFCRAMVTAALVLVATCRPAGAQEVAGIAPTTAPAADDLMGALDRMSPEELDRLIGDAVVSRLKVERQQVLAEIEQGLLYDPDDVDAAKALLDQSPANTQKDNIDRILAAFAKVDARFAKPYALWKQGQHAEAATAAKALANPQETTYLSAARFFLYAESLAAAGQGEPAVEAYREILASMPDRISFAATAALQAARTYDKMGRFVYAMEMYAYCLKNFGLTLDAQDAAELLKKIEEYQKLYKDPLGNVAGMMAQVKERLAQRDSGQDTQARQKQVAMVLEDLIKTMEEKQNNSSSSQSPQSDSKDQQDQQKKNSSGQSQGSGSTMGKAGGQPNSPAQTSMLVPGAVERPKKGSNVHDSGEQGDWAQMPPRQREQAQQAVRKVLSERCRDIISDYHTRMSQTRGND